MRLRFKPGSSWCESPCSKALGHLVLNIYIEMSLAARPQGSCCCSYRSGINSLPLSDLWKNIQLQQNHHGPQLELPEHHIVKWGWLSSAWGSPRDTQLFWVLAWILLSPSWPDPESPCSDTRSGLPRSSRWCVQSLGLGPVLPIPVKPPEASSDWTSLLHEKIMPPNHAFPSLEAFPTLGHRGCQQSFDPGQWWFPAARALTLLGLSQPSLSLRRGCPTSHLQDISLLLPTYSQSARLLQESVQETERNVGISSGKGFNTGN